MKTLAPEMNIIIIHVPTITVPVPRSGCNIIIPKARNTKLRAGSKPRLNDVINFCRSAKNFAKKIIIANFINSDGWIENAPIPIQLRAPPRTRPTPGIRTRIRRTKQTSKITFEYVRHTQ